MCNTHLMLGQTPVVCTHAYTHSHTFNTVTQAQYSVLLCKHPRETRTLTEAMKGQQKRRVAGPTTGCCSNLATCIVEKQRVRQPDVRHTQKNKQKKNKYKHTHTHKYACWFVCLYVERDRNRVRPPAVTYTQKSKQTNMHTCVSVYV